MGDSRDYLLFEKSNLILFRIMRRALVYWFLRVAERCLGAFLWRMRDVYTVVYERESGESLERPGNRVELQVLKSWAFEIFSLTQINLLT